MGPSFIIAAGPRQRSHSQVQIPRDSLTTFYGLRFETPQPGGPDPLIYIPQEYGDPAILSGTGFPFRRLL
jgi:hypothetical protein